VRGHAPTPLCRGDAPLINKHTEFLERLKARTDGKMTIIVSTHRLLTLLMVDRLLLFDKGRLVADERKETFYRLSSIGFMAVE
jgi:ABC-type multidrug transport system fused ATPase/permease subunit